MHGITEPDELAYWRERAKAAEKQLAELCKSLRDKTWLTQSDARFVLQLLDLLTQHDLANERQVSEGMRRLIDVVAHDIECVVRYRAARDSGGQHVGTGGALGCATPSALVYLERLVRDARRLLGEGKDKP